MTAPRGAGSNTYTFFFREPDALALACEHARQVSKAAPVAVWCVGCASGDEVYSLAIMALEHQVRLEILGSDIDAGALEQAQGGCYRARSLRHVDGARRERWFATEGRLLRVRNEVRAAVTFAHHDVAHEPPPVPRAIGAPGRLWDAIFCRHVLLYLDSADVSDALTSMISVLRPGGLLVLGASEWLNAHRQQQAPACTLLELAQIGGVIVRRKLVEAPRPAAEPPRPVAAAATKPPGPAAPFETRRPRPAAPAEAKPPRPRPDDMRMLREHGDWLLDAGHPADGGTRGRSGWLLAKMREIFDI